jgi:hypothetical protein
MENVWNIIQNEVFSISPAIRAFNVVFYETLRVAKPVEIDFQTLPMWIQFMPNVTHQIKTCWSQRKFEL